MKALQTRSPIHLFYQYTDLTKVVVSIYLEKDPNNFDTNTTPRYNLQSESINNESIFEISDLLRSANQYEFEKDFYENRDTAIYVLCKADLFDSNDAPIEVRHNFFRIRDGYVERQDQSQILNNTIPSDITQWTPFNSTVITEDFADPFGGDNAYKAADGSNNSLRAGFNTINNVTTSAVYTFSVWLQQVTNDRYNIGFGGGKNLSFDFSTELFYEITNAIIAFDVYEHKGWYKLSAVTFVRPNIEIEIISQDNAQNEEVYIFNPTLIKGNYINQDAKDLILQDNTQIFTAPRIRQEVLFDRKTTSDFYGFSSNFDDVFSADADVDSAQYNYGLIGHTKQRVEQDRGIFEAELCLIKTLKELGIYREPNNELLIFDDVAGKTSTQKIIFVDNVEQKYIPAKVSFINRFGVLQDLVFFKKRVDSSSTDSESYKANVIINGEVYPHLGQRRVYNKQAEAKVKLSSGFYPESFNTVFKQLIFSEMVFIDDEPAVISTSTFRQKTQIDDKLINYDIDFDFANDDINSIR